MGIESLSNEARQESVYFAIKSHSLASNQNNLVFFNHFLFLVGHWGRLQ